ncbi:hypothetical protein CEXT_741021, partial [Caerostris extrusa]
MIDPKVGKNSSVQIWNVRIRGRKPQMTFVHILIKLQNANVKDMQCTLGTTKAQGTTVLEPILLASLEKGNIASLEKGNIASLEKDNITSLAKGNIANLAKDRVYQNQFNKVKKEKKKNCPTGQFGEIRVPGGTLGGGIHFVKEGPEIAASFTRSSPKREKDRIRAGKSVHLKNEIRADKGPGRNRIQGQFGEIESPVQTLRGEIHFVKKALKLQRALRGVPPKERKI